jgi:hypothetical protein
MNYQMSWEQDEAEAQTKLENDFQFEPEMKRPGILEAFLGGIKAVLACFVLIGIGIVKAISFATAVIFAISLFLLAVAIRLLPIVIVIIIAIFLYHKLF